MLAAVTRDILDAAPDTTVRYVAHSVGAAVALSALSTLGDWGHRQPVTAVSLLGAGVSRDRFSTGEGFASAIESQVDQLDNYWSRTDEVLDWAFPDGTGDTALGSAGLDRAGPELYTDHLVDIETHGAYVDAEQGCLGAVVDAW
jgi:pimeloyl-ACP methyl ester carboxylesterase